MNATDVFDEGCQQVATWIDERTTAFKISNPVTLV